MEYVPNLDTYRCGGYMLAAAIERPAAMHESLMPSRILSVSNVCTHLPNVWSYVGSLDSDAYRRWKITTLGILPECMEDIVIWMTDLLEVDDAISWPDVFLSPDLGRQFVDQFHSEAGSLMLIGLGIHSKYLEDVQTKIEQRAGFWKAIDEPKRFAAGGQPLGFEPLGHAGAGSCYTWWADQIDRSLYEATAIQPNDAGFLSTEDEVDLCMSHIAEIHDLIEPGPWFPWLILEYAL
jgi:hypothetical protein